MHTMPETRTYQGASLEELLPQIRADLGNPKRIMLVAVHLIDAKPTPLMGRVLECEYHSDGLYRIALELIPLPESEVVAQWLLPAR